MVDDCLVKFENFQKQYIIIPLLSLNTLLLEEKLFITVRSPPGFNNQSNETRCYLNATFQKLYYNVLFRDLVFKINPYTMKDLMSKFYESNEVSGVICDECSKVRGTKKEV